MTALWQRRAAITVGALRFTGDQVVDGSIVPGLRISFRVKQTWDPKANEAEAEIYNLSPETRGKLMAAIPRARSRRNPPPPPDFAIEVGYAEGTAAVFRGKAYWAQPSWSPTGVSMKLNAQDGLIQHLVGNAVLRRGSNAAQAVVELGRAMGLDPVKTQAAAARLRLDAQLLRGPVTLCSPVVVEMSRLANTYGFEWAIVDGELVLTEKDHASATVATLLSPSTGLIGGPVPSVDQSFKRLTVKVKALLQPRLRPATLVQLDSAEFKGRYRVVSVEHMGDTRGQDWLSDVEMTEVPT